MTGSDKKADPFDLDNLRLDSEARPERRVSTPRKIERRREHFVKVPWPWVETLSGASGQTVLLALHLLYLHWKGREAPIKLANGMLNIDGISRWSKTRALGELERRKLLTIERRPRRSPIIRLNLEQDRTR
ncbi:hypothetical protein ACVWXO_008878 [Bradyrhizobium sp. LM2.7]